MPGQRKPKAKAETSVQPIVHGIYYCPPDAAWGGFVNIRLDDEQKENFLGWFEVNAGRTSELVDDLLGQSAKVALAFDAENQCYIATVTGALVSNSNERYVATSRAASLTEALGLAVWKHFYLCEGDYGNYKPRGSTFMKWG